VSRFLWIAFAVLLALLLVTVAAYFMGKEAEWLKEVSVNMTAEVAGIIITVFLIDRVISLDRERERRKRQGIAFKQLRPPLHDQLMVLFNIFKASVERKPEKRYETVPDLFDEAYFEAVKHFDCSAPAPAETVIEEDGLDYLRHEGARYREDLDRTVEKYADFLDLATLDVIEENIRSPFLLFLTYEATTDQEAGQKAPRKERVFEDDAIRGQLKSYAEIFCRLVEVYNGNVPEDRRMRLREELWKEDVEPKTGSRRAD